jgi:peptidoglycan/LPS O-acetylase OafA/YrhL
VAARHPRCLLSLAIEEQFYLLWPLLVRFLSRRVLLGVALGLVVGAGVLRSTLYYGFGVNGIAIYVLTPCRIDTLALGSILALDRAAGGGRGPGHRDRRQTAHSPR